MDLREIAASRGMRSLLQDGLRQVLAELTKPEEVLRTCQG
jgi:type II secretory ATPase GspE/PulE/Tfp pilus assembly ATPase PilB-like protein